MDSLLFSRDAAGAYDGSPYDVFLRQNRLPRQPADGETDRAYSERLLGLPDARSDWQLSAPRPAPSRPTGRNLRSENANSPA